MTVDTKEWELVPYREITADWKQRAYEQLSETDELRPKALQEFREKVKDLENLKARVDDEFLLRFLRTKKYNQEKALKMYRNFFRVRLLDPKIYSPVGHGPLDFDHLYKLGVGYLLKHRNPINGACVIVWQFGDWTPETGYDLSHIYTPTLFAVDYALKDPEVQLNGFMFLINFTGMEWRFLKVFGVNAVRCLIQCAQDGYPSRFKGAHIINHSSLFNIVWAIAKPFLSYKIQDRVRFHNDNLEALHEHIHPSILPVEFGGQQPPLSIEWFTQELYKRNDEYYKNSFYGYKVDE